MYQFYNTKEFFINKVKLFRCTFIFLSKLFKSIVTDSKVLKIYKYKLLIILNYFRVLSITLILGLKHISKQNSFI